MSDHGVTASQEIRQLKASHQVTVDDLLEKLQAVVLERDVAQERLAFAENELANCYESNGRSL